MELTDEAAEARLSVYQRFALEQERQEERDQSRRKISIRSIELSHEITALKEARRAEAGRVVGAEVLIHIFPRGPSVLCADIAACMSICSTAWRDAMKEPLIRAQLEDSRQHVRLAALEKLQVLEPRKLAKYAGAVVEKLADDNMEMQRDVTNVLVRLEQTVLAEHADRIVAMLEDENVDDFFVFEMIFFLELPGAKIAEHATTIAAKLGDTNDFARYRALELLFELDPGPRQAYIPAFIAALTDSDYSVADAGDKCFKASLEGLELAALEAYYDQLLTINQPHENHVVLQYAIEWLDSKIRDLGGEHHDY